MAKEVDCLSKCTNIRNCRFKLKKTSVLDSPFTGEGYIILSHAG